MKVIGSVKEDLNLEKRNSFRKNLIYLKLSLIFHISISNFCKNNLKLLEKMNYLEFSSPTAFIKNHINEHNLF